MRKLKVALIGLLFALAFSLAGLVFVPSSLAGNCAKCIARFCMADQSSGYASCSVDCSSGTCICSHTFPTCTSPP